MRPEREREREREREKEREREIFYNQYMFYITLRIFSNAIWEQTQF